MATGDRWGPTGWTRGGVAGQPCGRTRDGGLGFGRPAPSGFAAVVGRAVGRAFGWVESVREAVRRRIGSVARQVARFVRDRGRARPDTGGWRRGQGPVVTDVAEGPVEGAGRGTVEGWGPILRAGFGRADVAVGEAAEPAALVWWDEARRARIERIWDRFRRGEVVAVVSPNPQVDPRAEPWGVYADGRPAYVHADWSTWPGARVGLEAFRAWEDGYPRNAWDRTFGRWYAVDVSAESTDPWVPLAFGLDAATAGAPVSMAPFDQPCGAWAPALEPARGADAAAHPASAAVADPAGEPVGANPFVGFLAEPCGCDGVVGGHTLGDCRWSHLAPRFDLEDPYV